MDRTSGHCRFPHGCESSPQVPTWTSQNATEGSHTTDHVVGLVDHVVVPWSLVGRPVQVETVSHFVRCQSAGSDSGSARQPRCPVPYIMYEL